MGPMAKKILEEKSVWSGTPNRVRGVISFDDYCKAKWGMGRHYAHYLVNGSKVAANLLTRVNMMPPCEIQPIYERQVRPLTIL